MFGVFYPYYKAAILGCVLAVSACGPLPPTEEELRQQEEENRPIWERSGTLISSDQPEYLEVAIGDRVLFPVDQSSLTRTAQVILVQQANWLRINTQYNIVIEGHADEQGTREYNIALGAQRAAAVRDFLVAQGVAAHRVRTVSYGKERPIQICSEERCYEQNRRAVTALSQAYGYQTF
jgi:peptidoglycan-associated lipoprotein